MGKPHRTSSRPLAHHVRSSVAPCAARNHRTDHRFNPLTRPSFIPHLHPSRRNPFSSFRFTCGRRRRSHECGLNDFSSPSKGAGVRVSLDVSRASLAPPPARSLRMQFCRYARILFFLGVDCSCGQVSLVHHLLGTLAVHAHCL